MDIDFSPHTSRARAIGPWLVERGRFGAAGELRGTKFEPLKL